MLITGYAVGRRAPASRSGRWPRWSPISGSARGRGRRGRWRDGAWSGWAARRSPWPPGADLGRVGLAVACGLAGFAYGALLDLSRDGDLRRRAVARPLPGDLRARDPLQRRPRRRQRRPGPGRRAGAGTDDLSLPEPVRVHLAPGAGAVSGPGDVRRRAGVGARRRPIARRPRCSRGRWPFRRRPGPAVGRPLPPGWSGRRTPTAASPPPPAAPRARRSRAGPCWGWRPPAAIPLDLRRGGPSPIAYLRSQADALRSTGDLERTILALEGAGVSPRGFGGRDLVAELRRRQAARGSYEGQVNLTAFGILALRAAGGRPPRLSALGRLARARPRTATAAGAFSRASAERPGQHGRRAPGAGGCRRRSRGDASGVAYLRATQRGDGGFALGGGGPSTRSRPPGPIRAWWRPGSTRRRPRRRAHAARLPRRSAGGRRPLPLLGIERPDAGLGDRRRRCRPSTRRRSRSPRSRARRPAADRAEAKPGGGAARRRAGSAPSGRRRTAEPAAEVASGGARRERRASARRRRSRARASSRAGAAASSAPVADGRAAGRRGLGAARRLRRRRPRRRSSRRWPAASLWHRAPARPGGPRPRRGPAAQLGYRSSAMDVETAIRTRRTHKAYRPEPVAREVLDELLDLARWAPNHT